jgi:hypothetical protein
MWDFTHFTQKESNHHEHFVNLSGHSSWGHIANKLGKLY